MVFDCALTTSRVLLSTTADSLNPQAEDIFQVSEGRLQTGHYLDLRSFLFLSRLLSMVFSLSPLHLGQYHLPLGL